MTHLTLLFPIENLTLWLWTLEGAPVAFRGKLKFNTSSSDSYYHMTAVKIHAFKLKFVIYSIVTLYGGFLISETVNKLKNHRFYIKNSQQFTILDLPGTT